MTERVQKVAKEMGYRPNPVLASLASKRFSESASIEGTPLALLEFPSNGVDGPVPIHYRKALADSCTEFGYSSMRLSFEELKSYNNPSRTLYNRGVNGIVISGQPSPDFFNNSEEWMDFSLIQCGRFRSSMKLSCVRPNIFQAVKLVFMQAYQRGYRRIGFCFGQHGIILEDDEARIGTAMGLLKHLETKNRIPVFEGRFDDESGKLAWIKKHKPDMVIGFTDNEWYLLREAGYRMPEEIGYASLQMDNYHRLENNIAGLCQETDQIAWQSVIHLDQMIRHKIRGIPEHPLDVLLPSTWHEGKSMRALNTTEEINQPSGYLASSAL